MVEVHPWLSVIYVALVIPVAFTYPRSSLWYRFGWATYAWITCLFADTVLVGLAALFAAIVHDTETTILLSIVFLLNIILFVIGIHIERQFERCDDDDDDDDFTGTPDNGVNDYGDDNDRVHDRIYYHNDYRDLHNNY